MFLIPTLSVFSIFLAQGDAFGFYWREFDGTIPEDAFAAGRDQFNRPIYVGQVLHNHILMPAKIYENDKTVYYELGDKEYTTTNNVKIFCTDEPDLFEWIPSNTDDIKKLTNKFLVKGGYEPDHSTYIGRIRTEGEVLVGKLLADSAHNGLHVTQNGKAFHFNTYEVLSYQVKEKVDVRHSSAVFVK